MKITEVRIFPTESRDGKLKAFATMTFDDWFVVRNVKVIQGNSGFFVAMPSRKAMDSCPKCQFKNVVGSKYCNQCASELPINQGPEAKDVDSHGNHMDIAHPISQECRLYIQDKILEAYRHESGEKENIPANNIGNNLEKEEATPVTSPIEATTIKTAIEEAKDIAL